MSIWMCRPSLVKWGVDVNLGCAEMSDGSFIKDISDTDLKVGLAQLLDGDTMVVVDTENIEKSLYDAFCDSGWENGESLGFTKKDAFAAKEYEKYFDIYVNDKIVAKFYKDRQFC